MYTFKGLCDNFAAIKKLVLNKKRKFLPPLIGPQYKTFNTTMLKLPRPSYFESISQLQSLDQRHNWFTNHTNNSNLFTP